MLTNYKKQKKIKITIGERPMVMNVLLKFFPMTKSEKILRLTVEVIHLILAILRIVEVILNLAR